MSFAPKVTDWRRMPQEVRELLLGALQQRASAVSGEKLSPVQLAEACGLTPDAWQGNVLSSDAKQIILLCSRQSGKSTVSALLALHQAICISGSLALIVAPALRQSQETFRKVKDCLAQLGTIQPAAESALRLEFHNRSRIVVIPGNERTTRGYSGVNLLVCDEAAQLADSAYQALRPSMAVSQGRIILLSTPAGQRGFFHSEWTTGGNDWLRVRVPASECSRIDAAWLAAERERVGSWWASQEYDCEFIDSSTQIFATEDVMRCLSDEVEPLWD
jgi:hypothetical protein